ncbi:MAG TPA: hypothetical protein VLG46_08745, partial [Anaerolineae bacterium]|nr:hypothetical protein [Anaerolineae bacterium]
MKNLFLLIAMAGLIAGCGAPPTPNSTITVSSTPPIKSANPTATTHPIDSATPLDIPSGDPTVASRPTLSASAAPTIQEYTVPPGSHPHDVAPAPDGTVWYTAQTAGA